MLNEYLLDIYFIYLYVIIKKNRYLKNKQKNVQILLKVSYKYF